MLNPLQLLGQTADQAASRVSSLQVSEVDDWVYLEAVDDGLSAVLDETGRIRAIHLYPFGHEGYHAFSGMIPSGLQFDMTRDVVRATLGPPQRSGGAAQMSTDWVFGGPWDLFGLGDATIHVEYGSDEKSVALITLSSIVQ